MGTKKEWKDRKDGGVVIQVAAGCQDKFPEESEWISLSGTTNGSLFGFYERDPLSEFKRDTVIRSDYLLH
ncbi:hypothetical protein EU727_08570 [Salmonella enterica]|nr:hypothetical protein [Salmonella enterica]